MNPTLAPWRAEAIALGRLALPFIAGNAAWAIIAATQLALLSRLGPSAVGAAALAFNFHQLFLVFGIGLVAVISPLVAEARARADVDGQIRRIVQQALIAAAGIVLPAWAILWHSEPLLIAAGQNAALAAGAGELMRGLQWALLPLIFFHALRNLISALERPLWGVAILLLGIPVNYALAWLLVFGNLGAPRLGLFGAGLAISLSAAAMLAAMIAVLAADVRFRRLGLHRGWRRLDRSGLRRLCGIGFPIAVVQVMDFTVFGAAALLMGLIGPATLAAHAVALQIGSLCFMVPLGIGQAATVRVGRAYGAGDRQAVGRAGWTAMIAGLALAVATAIGLLAWAAPLSAQFLDPAAAATRDSFALAVSFLTVIALFQLVDAAQIIGGASLRGLQDTRVPMLIALVGYWVVGIGGGSLLAFPLGYGGIGIWLGLAIGIAAVAVMTLARWSARDRLFERPMAT